MPNLRYFVFVLGIILTGTGIIGCRPIADLKSPSSDKIKASRHYQKSHDYQSLLSLLPHLNTLTMRRAEVEQLLGAPVYAPSIGSVYYTTEKSIMAGCLDNTELQGKTCRTLATGQTIPPVQLTLTLVMDYDCADNQTRPQGSDRLSGFWLGPVGE